MRNLRVARVLQAWLAERTTYFSCIPRDIIHLVLAYISPETWNHLFSFNLKTSYFNHGSWDEIDQLVLADGAIIIIIYRYACLYLAPGATDLVQLMELGTNCRHILAPDPQMGLWYLHSDQPTLCHYNPASRHILRQVHLPKIVMNFFTVTSNHHFLIPTAQTLLEFDLDSQLVAAHDITYGQWKAQKNRLSCYNGNGCSLLDLSTLPPTETVVIVPAEPIDIWHDFSYEDTFALSATQIDWLDDHNILVPLLVFPPDLSCYSVIRTKPGHLLLLGQQDGKIVVYDLF